MAIYKVYTIGKNSIQISENGDIPQAAKEVVDNAKSRMLEMITAINKSSANTQVVIEQAKRGEVSREAVRDANQQNIKAQRELSQFIQQLEASATKALKG